MTSASDPCPFCEIVAGRAPARHPDGVDRTVHYSNGDGPDMIIEPLNPVTPGHVIVIPGEHVEDFSTDADVTARIMSLASIYAQFHEGPMNLITSRGVEATQSVFHLHVHLVPRREGDGLPLPWTDQEKRERLRALAESPPLPGLIRTAPLDASTGAPGSVRRTRRT